MLISRDLIIWGFRISCLQLVTFAAVSLLGDMPAGALYASFIGALSIFVCPFPRMVSPANSFGLGIYAILSACVWFGCCMVAAGWIEVWAAIGLGLVAT